MGSNGTEKRGQGRGMDALPGRGFGAGRWGGGVEKAAENIKGDPGGRGGDPRGEAIVRPRRDTRILGERQNSREC